MFEGLTEQDVNDLFLGPTKEELFRRNLLTAIELLKTAIDEKRCTNLSVETRADRTRMVTFTLKLPWSVSYEY